MCAPFIEDGMITNVISTSFSELIDTVLPYFDGFFFYSIGLMAAAFVVIMIIRGLKAGAG